MRRIDAHQHFWQYQAERDSWISGDMSILRHDFLPSDLEPIVQANQVSGCIAVQADQSEEETYFLLNLAKMHPFIKGVVGWVDLRSAQIEERLAHFSRFNKLKGFRHIVQGEPDPQFVLHPSFIRGVSALHKFGFTYDILVKPKQLNAVLKFVRQLDEDQKLVVDHMAKPYIAQGKKEPWAAEMKALAEYPNVCCKLSGMVTEAHWRNWTVADFSFYIDHLLEVFGPDRLLFGSDWPVCLLAASYEQVVEIVDTHIKTLSLPEQEAIWYKNAERVYNL